MLDHNAIVNTRAGLLEGTYIDGVYRFYGVHYADPPTGEYRFLPPQPLTPWNGVKSAKELVPKCYQTDEPSMEDKTVTGTPYYKANIKMLEGSSEMGVGPMTEDCLALNIWTQGLADNAKRPVMVWFHGGGNIGGDAGALWHDGFNLAKKQDVVVVNVGHRLNIFGYLYLAGFGNEKYKDSVNLGHQDMAFALQWIHDNIEAFGGDPENVTIFGQSGGAEKVVSLLVMPAARGLVHKAIVQSGGFEFYPAEDGIRAAREFLQALNIDEDHLDELQKIPPEDLIAKYREINADRHSGQFLRFPIINDGKVIAYNPIDGAEGTAFNKDVTIMLGNCKDDLRLFALVHNEYFNYTEDEAKKHLQRMGYTEKQSQIIVDRYRAMLREEYGHEPTGGDIFLAYLTDNRFRKMAENWYAARKAVGAKPFYNFVFCFECPDPILKAIHGVDVPYAFDNACYAPGTWSAETYRKALKLSENMSAAWAAFARTGNPSHSGIPVWKPYDDVNRYTMLLDVECKLVSDYHKDGREIAMGIGLGDEEPPADTTYYNYSNKNR